MKTYKGDCPEVLIKYKKGNIKRAKLCSSSDSYEYFKGLFDSDLIDYCESFFAVFMNRANNSIAWIKLSQGGIAGTVVDVRMLAVAALKVGASSIIIAHNHPSGNLKPSKQDLEITKKVVEGLKILDIVMYDHLIITSEGYYSMADECDF